MTIAWHRTLPRVGRATTETVVGISFPRSHVPTNRQVHQSPASAHSTRRGRRRCGCAFSASPLLALARDESHNGMKGIRDERVRCAWTPYADAMLHVRSAECCTIHLRVRRACETLSCSRERLNRKSKHPRRRTTPAHDTVRACRGRGAHRGAGRHDSRLDCGERGHRVCMRGAEETSCGARCRETTKSSIGRGSRFPQLGCRNPSVRSPRVHPRYSTSTYSSPGATTPGDATAMMRSGTQDGAICDLHESRLYVTTVYESTGPSASRAITWCVTASCSVCLRCATTLPVVWSAQRFDLRVRKRSLGAGGKPPCGR